LEKNRLLHSFAVIVAACTLALIYVGGLVTSTGSGLSVPDWPLSFGQVFPPMEGGVRYEHGHRLAAAFVGLLTVALALWLWRRESRSWLRRLGLLAVLAVVAQGVLGGITVLLKLPLAVSVAHAALAEAFLCVTVSIAVFTSPWWQRQRAEVSETPGLSTRRLALVATAATYVQILIGALVRHTGSGLAIPDFPLSFGRLVPPDLSGGVLLNFSHRLGALAVAGLVLWLCGRTLVRHDAIPGLRIPSLILLFALGLQVILGAETVWTSRAAIPTTLHVLGGASTLAASLVLTLAAHRVLQPAPLRRRTAAAQTRTSMG
jgi:cytochrome c oxidase assembly protein subunit 15